MEHFALLIQGFGTALTPMNVGACMLGAILGLIVGAMPGIGSLAGVALLLPLTYKFNPATAIIMLGALYYSNMYGGSFSAILLNIPGDSPAVCTTLDGYPMATKRKRPGQALLTANMASCIGGTIGMIILTFTGPGPCQSGIEIRPVRDDSHPSDCHDVYQLAGRRKSDQGCSHHLFWYSAGKYGNGYAVRCSKI